MKTIYPPKSFTIKAKLFIVIFIFVLYLIFIITEKLTSRRSPHSDKVECYYLNKLEETLPDISEFKPPPTENSIFFHETSCRSHSVGRIAITARQACAVESAARLNPQNRTFLVYASTGALKLDGKTESDRFLRALLQYENIQMLYANFENYSKNTPLEPLRKRGVLQSSQFPVSHASDLFRYLTLWKYGGTYLDLDVIVVKPLADLGLNYVGFQSTSDLAAGILNFGVDDLGRKVAENCLIDLTWYFDGDDWVNNGPNVIRRVLDRICRGKLSANMVKSACQGFRVYPPEKFYAINYEKWSMFLSENELELVRNKTKNSYLVHFWNKFSGEQKLDRRSRAAYSLLAAEFCPEVYKEVDEFF